jgi:hypothetical protein
MKNSPIYLQGIFKDEEEFLKMFSGERTLSWMDHNPFMAEGFAEFFKSGYIGNLINSWIPAIDNGNVLEKLKKGANVADVGWYYYFDDGKNISRFYIYRI